MITAPLTSLLKGKPKVLHWTPEAEQAFQTLKEAFTTAPLLQHPNPEKRFIVEVDASTTGVGTILSQHSENATKTMPCAFFSKKLSPAERNYDISNRELLAVKLVLERWRHWLEGAWQPFLVLMITKICNTRKKPRDLTLTRPCGLFSLLDFIFRSPIALDPRTPEPIPCHVCTSWRRILRTQSLSYPPSCS